jgi:hypothetical protein
MDDQGIRDTVPARAKLFLFMTAPTQPLKQWVLRALSRHKVAMA